MACTGSGGTAQPRGVLKWSPPSASRSTR